MRTRVDHLMFNVRETGFYREWLEFLGWALVFDDGVEIGMRDGEGTTLWFQALGDDAPPAPDWDGVGLNHLGIGCDAVADVDAAAEWLRERGVDLLFGTPAHRPEYAEGEGTTYYSVIFPSPDRLMLEVVYTGPI